MSHQTSGTEHRVEAVVASSRPNTWYERVVVTADDTTGAHHISCTCTEDHSSARCAHAAAALLSQGRRTPALLPGRRRSEEPPQITLSSSAEGDWLDLHVQVDVGGHSVEFADLFRALAAGHAALDLPDGTYLPLDAPEFIALRELIQEADALSPSRDSALRLNRHQLDLWADFSDLPMVRATQNQWWERVSALRTGVQPRPTPSGLTADLRDYQQHGYSWLTFLLEHQLGGILADDMGLGKTIQAIAMITDAVERGTTGGPFLIVAPTSVVHNWGQEFQRWSPGLRVTAIEETQRRRHSTVAEVAADADVVLTSYALFRLEAKQYQRLSWTGLLLDEAQMIKNPASQSYRAVRDMAVGCTLALTGTPLENNLQELWALVSLTAPGLLGTREDFQRAYRIPIEQHRETAVLHRLHRRIQPFVLRRTKAQVAQELPSKQEQSLYVRLDADHRAAYDQHLQRHRRDVLNVLATGASGLTGKRFEILAALNHLRQLALDPELVGITGIRSSKIKVLEQMIPEITAEGHRVLVLSQYTRFLKKAQRHIEAQSVSTAYLDGGTRDRQKVVQSFREGEAEAFFISLRAGGFGLNLVEADYVILLDPWWNPAAEEQAIDRTHRIGQTRPVTVYRLIAQDTIEAKVAELQQSKRDLFSSVMDSGHAATATGLTAENIQELLGRS